MKLSLSKKLFKYKIGNMASNKAGPLYRIGENFPHVLKRFLNKKNRPQFLIKKSSNINWDYELWIIKNEYENVLLLKAKKIR